jgi:two-component system, cell cycle sensor histidine kinase and response regulator CckA
MTFFGKSPVPVLDRTPSLEWEIAIDAISDGIAVVDAAGRIQRANSGFAALLGLPKTGLVGTLCTLLWGNLPEDKQPFLRTMQSGRRENIELEYGSRRLSVTVDPILDDLGIPAGAVHIVSDVTATHELEEQFRDAQKFETVGALAAGVAHDFNNLLTSIMGNASLILGELPPESDHRDRLRDVVHASHRAADLTRQLLAYSGKGRHFMQKVELSGLVKRIRELIEAALPKKIALQFLLAPALPSIEADANQVQQIVLNLVNNAAEAIGDDSGTIAIETGLDPEGGVFLEVADTGCGMDAETKARIFDPFFTTKFTGRGLGLAAVSGIVRSHKAAIRVTSAPNQGSAFRICFPCEAAAPTAAQPGSAASTDAGPHTVLVVDDEEMVRRVARATLEIRGHKVLMANNGLEAIRVAGDHPEIAIVLLDLTMPVMGGEEAIDRILAVRPGVRVIVSTGFGHREAAARFGRKNVAGFLQKPYTSKQLADKITAVLAPATA